MSELKEGIAATKPSETSKKGKVKVTVRDICTGKRIKDVSVILNNSTKKTEESDDLTFDNVSAGMNTIKANAHFKDADYLTFVVQTLVVNGNNITRSWEAKSSTTDTVIVKEDAETRSRIELVVFKPVEKMVYHRRNIMWAAGEDDDKYGHWWTVVDENTSFGWWPKYPVGSDENRLTQPPKPPKPLSGKPSTLEKVQYMFDSVVYNAKSKLYSVKEGSAMQTFRGVEGEVNGIIFGGTATRDPHHIKGDEGEQQYQPVINDCREHSDIKDSVINFANTYSAKYGGTWSWRVERGNHCHTFQKRLMKDLNLEKVKKLK